MNATPRRYPRLHPKAPVFALSVLTLAALTGCFGGGDDEEEEPQPPAAVTLSGVVADGPLAGATACYDLNDNEACDSGEPSTPATDAQGRYSFELPAAEAGKHAVLAFVPATAVDQDNGRPIGAALVFKAPATGLTGTQTVFVSALTTAVVEVARQQGLTAAQAAAQVQATLGLDASPLGNFVTNAGDGSAPQAARALTQVLVNTTRLAADANVTAPTALLRELVTQGLPSLASALAAATGATAAERAAAAAAAVAAEHNLSTQTVAQLAEQAAKPSAPAEAPGPFVSLRRFAYTDANNYSYTVFVGDTSQADAQGHVKVHEVRKAVSAGADQPFNRNQMYWTGSAWRVCALQWQVSTIEQQDAALGTQTSTYCDASRTLTSYQVEDIAGKTLREVVTRIRAWPQADSPGTHTDTLGLPVHWGPEPALLPQAATFPSGSRLSLRRSAFDVGSTDRIELTTKSTVRWADGRFRQAVTLEQYGSMQGDLVNAATAVVNNNTVYVDDVPLAAQPDASLEAFKRYRAAFDMTALIARIYRCDVRRSDQAALNCEAAANATLAITTQGGSRLLRFAGGYPAELRQALKRQRFWAEHSGTVFRGQTDLPGTRVDQRLNAVAWEALRTALSIPEHAAAQAPAAAGLVGTLRNFTYTDASNHSLRVLRADTSTADASGNYAFSEERLNRSNGNLVPFQRNALYWTGDEWYACADDGQNIGVANVNAPFDSLYCKSYRDRRASSVTLTLAGRRMADVLNDMRAYGSKDGSFSYSDFGPNPAAVPTLATQLFPAGSTLEYRGNERLATPFVVGTALVNRVRVAPSPNSTAPFDSWPYAVSLEEFIAKHPGNFFGGNLNGNVAFFVHGFDLAAAPAPQYTSRVEFRVAFDANGQKARFWKNNRDAVTGFTTNYQLLLDTTYTVETVGGVRLLRFAAMPAGFVDDFNFQRLFAERGGAVWYAWKDHVPGSTDFSLRLNLVATDALRAALGITN